MPSLASLTVHVCRATAGKQPRGNQMRSMFVIVNAIISLSAVTILPLSELVHSLEAEVVVWLTTASMPAFTHYIMIGSSLLKDRDE